MELVRVRFLLEHYVGAKKYPMGKVAKFPVGTAKKLVTKEVAIYVDHKGRPKPIEKKEQEVKIQDTPVDGGDNDTPEQAESEGDPEPKPKRKRKKIL